MRRPQVFMMHGVTAAGKTQTSFALATQLDLIRLSTSQLKIEMGMRPRTQDYSLRDCIYEQVAQKLRVGLEEGRSFVLDGTFALRRWRKRIYEACSEGKAELSVVACLCENQSEVRRRLAARRKKSVQTPDEEADGIEYWATEKQEIEEILGDELRDGRPLQIFVVDTYLRRVFSYVLAHDSPSTKGLIEEILGFGS